MPAAYAHYVFGQKVLKELPRDLQERIKDYLPLYHIGIHGPDILFYYEPLHSNEISRLGYEMHDAEAEEFFENARRKKRMPDGNAVRPAEKRERLHEPHDGLLPEMRLESGGAGAAQSAAAGQG